MSNLKKMIFGFASSGFLLCFIAFFGLTSIFGTGQDLSVAVRALTYGFLFGLIPFGLLSLGMNIYFIIHALNKKTLDVNSQICWIISLATLIPLAGPVYWYFHIWKAELELERCITGSALRTSHQIHARRRPQHRPSLSQS